VYDRNAVRLALIHMLPDVASDLGVRLEPLLEGAGIVGHDIPWDDRVVVRAQVCAVLRGLARSAGDAQVGFRLGPAADAGRLGLSGDALFAGATLRDCLALHALHMPDLQLGVEMAVVERGGQAHWIHRMRDADPEAAGHLTEGIAAFVVGAVRAILGDPEAKLLITFPHRPLAPISSYEEALRCAVAFRSGADLSITFDAALLDRLNVLQPLPARLHQGGTNSRSAMRTIEGAALDDADLLVALRGIIAVAALVGTPALRSACGILGISPRSLQRRLSGMGMNWVGLVDHWRREEAEAMLADPRHRVGSVARRLGYSDPAHFHRAFRRWTGTTPTAFREDLARGGRFGTSWRQMAIAGGPELP
jgi:AraC-like DNA-binding protein